MTTILPIVGSNVLFAAGLVLFAGVVTRFWRSPQLAHALWALVLLKLITPPLAVVSVPREWFFEPSVPAEFVTAADVARNLESVADGVASPTWATDDRLPARAQDEASMPSLVVGAHKFEAEASAPAGTTETPIEPTLREWSAGLATRQWPNIVGIIWCVGAMAYALILLRRFARFRRVLAASSDAPSDIVAAVARLAPALGLKRCPPARVVDTPIPPLVWSLGIKPLILLPSELLRDLDAPQRDAVIAHELAHVRRRDDLVRWLEIVALIAFWWNPAAWLARRKLREAEEECCDAWVVCVLPDQRRSYGHAMFKTIEFLTNIPALPVLAGSAFGSSFYKRRIEMILQHEFRRSASWQAKLALLVLSLVVLPLAATAMSQDGTAPSAELRAKQPDEAARGESQAGASDRHGISIPVSRDGRVFHVRPVGDHKPVVHSITFSIGDGKVLHLRTHPDAATNQEPADPKGAVEEQPRSVDGVISIPFSRDGRVFHIRPVGDHKPVVHSITFSIGDGKVLHLRTYPDDLPNKESSEAKGPEESQPGARGGTISIPSNSDGDVLYWSPTDERKPVVHSITFGLGDGKIVALGTPPDEVSNQESDDAKAPVETQPRSAEGVISIPFSRDGKVLHLLPTGDRQPVVYSIMFSLGDGNVIYLEAEPSETPKLEQSEPTKSSRHDGRPARDPRATTEGSAVRSNNAGEMTIDLLGTGGADAASLGLDQAGSVTDAIGVGSDDQGVILGFAVPQELKAGWEVFEFPFEVTQRLDKLTKLRDWMNANPKSKRGQVEAEARRLKLFAKKIELNPTLDGYPTGPVREAALPLKDGEVSEPIPYGKSVLLIRRIGDLANPAPGNPAPAIRGPKTPATQVMTFQIMRFRAKAGHPDPSVWGQANTPGILKYLADHPQATPREIGRRFNEMQAGFASVSVTDGIALDQIKEQSLRQSAEKLEAGKTHIIFLGGQMVLIRRATSENERTGDSSKIRTDGRIQPGGTSSRLQNNVRVQPGGESESAVPAQEGGSRRGAPEIPAVPAASVLRDMTPEQTKLLTQFIAALSPTLSPQERQRTREWFRREWAAKGFTVTPAIEWLLQHDHAQANLNIVSAFFAASEARASADQLAREVEAAKVKLDEESKKLTAMKKQWEQQNSAAAVGLPGEGTLAELGLAGVHKPEALRQQELKVKLAELEYERAKLRRELSRAVENPKPVPQN